MAVVQNYKISILNNPAQTKGYLSECPFVWGFSGQRSPPPVLFKMLGRNEFTLRQVFRRWQKTLVQRKSAVLPCGGRTMRGIESVQTCQETPEIFGFWVFLLQFRIILCESKCGSDG